MNLKWTLLWTLALCWGLALWPVLSLPAAVLWTATGAGGLTLTLWYGLQTRRNAPQRPRLAVHEAGHALYLAAAPRDEYSHATLIPDEVDGRTVYGSVTYHRPPDAQPSARLLWEMQYALAGEIAEELTFGQGSGGNVQDLEQFALLARDYLGGDGDQAALRAREEAHVRRFLHANQDVLAQVARQLAWRGELDAGRLYGLLRAVRSTSGLAFLMPAPNEACACAGESAPPYSQT